MNLDRYRDRSRPQAVCFCAYERLNPDQFALGDHTEPLNRNGLLSISDTPPYHSIGSAKPI
jgi:hypothetical protein